MKQNGLDKKVEAMLADPKFKTDAAWRKTALEELRKAIVDAPIDPATLDTIYKRVRLKLGGKGVFVRSSTERRGPARLQRCRPLRHVSQRRRQAGARRGDQEGLGVAVEPARRRRARARSASITARSTARAGPDRRQRDRGRRAVTKNLWDPRRRPTASRSTRSGASACASSRARRCRSRSSSTRRNDGTKIISRADDPVMLVFDDKGGIEGDAGSAGRRRDPDRGAREDAGHAWSQKFMPLFTHGQPLDVEWVLEGEDVWIVQARPFVGS